MRERIEEIERDIREQERNDQHRKEELERNDRLHQEEEDHKLKIGQSDRDCLTQTRVKNANRFALEQKRLELQEIDGKNKTSTPKYTDSRWSDGPWPFKQTR